MYRILDIVLAFMLQIAFTVGLIYLFGWLIAICNHKFYSNLGRSSRIVCYATGFLGTPVHELAHALFCVVFGHKIVEIKLFQMDAADGTLGYVSHSYNPKNIYHKIGNFFIGVAPILVISALLYLFAYLLLPQFVAELSIFIRSGESSGSDQLLSGFFNMVGTFFSLAATWQWWVFLLVGAVFSLHMTLSNADRKGAWSGLIFVLLVFLIADIVLGIVSSKALDAFTSAVIAVGCWLLCSFVLALAISLIALLISQIFRWVKRRSRR